MRRGRVQDTAPRPSAWSRWIASRDGCYRQRAVRDKAALLELVQRDWDNASRSKARYWSAWKQQHGAAAGIAMADELRRQVLAARPGWPSEEERREDLRSHLEVIDALRRVPPRGR